MNEEIRHWDAPFDFFRSFRPSQEGVQKVLIDMKLLSNIREMKEFYTLNKGYPMLA